MKSLYIATTSLLSGFAVYTLDKVTKHLFFPLPTTSPGFWFFGGLIQQIQHRNLGITFDIPIPTSLIVVLSVIAFGCIALGLQRAMYRRSFWEGLALGILLGGALGNFIDRITFGFVRDWLLVFFHTALNIADLAILTGLLLYIWVRGRDAHSKIDEPSATPPSMTH